MDDKRSLIRFAAFDPACHNKYKPEYCEQIVQYFSAAPQTKTEAVKTFIEESSTEAGSKKSMKQEVQTIVAELPTLERFAGSIGISVRAMSMWTKKHPDFAVAVELAKDRQRDFMIQGMTSGRIPGLGGSFVAKNLNIGMSDDQNLTITQIDNKEKPILAEKTPQQLEALKAVVMAAEAAGVKVTIEDLKKG